MTAIRPHDAAFREAVEPLRVPGAGTEVVAPLLGRLVQLLRPRRVLEVGMGYTTPFLAAALAELEEDIVPAESRALAEKSAPYLEQGRPLDDAWLYGTPALLAPSFYREPYRARFAAVDDLSLPDSSAARVESVLTQLALRDRVTVVNAELRHCAERLPVDLTPIDFAWVDAWECLYFFDHFWERINPQGGVVIMHYLMTYPEGEAILRYLSEFQRAHAGEMEVLSLLEPHKAAQNSVTLLRRTAGPRHRGFARPGGRLDYAGVLREDAESHARALAEP